MQDENVVNCCSIGSSEQVPGKGGARQGALRASIRWTEKLLFFVFFPIITIGLEYSDAMIPTFPKGPLDPC